LAQSIDQAVAQGRWKPIQLASNGLKLSHLFFADDLILFAEASMDQVQVINDCLEGFCASSVNIVSKEKSPISLKDYKIANKTLFIQLLYRYYLFIEY